MSLIRLLYSTSVYVALALGLPANLTMLWMILRRSPPHINDYRRNLLQTCILDFVVLFAQTAVQPMVLFSDDGAPMGVLTSPLVRWCPSPWNVVFYFCWWFPAAIYMQQFGLQFFYRWLAFTRDRIMPLSRYMLLLFLPSCVQLGVDTALLFYDSLTSPHENITSLVSDSLEISIQANPFRTAETFSGQIFQAAEMVYGVLTYIPAVVYGYKMHRFVGGKEAKSSANSRTRDWELDKQLNRLLISQALATFVVLHVPSIALITSFSLQLFVPSYRLLVWLFTMPVVATFWIPVFNPLVTLLFVKRYRECVCEAIAELKQQPIARLKQLTHRAPSTTAPTSSLSVAPSHFTSTTSSKPDVVVVVVGGRCSTAASNNAAVGRPLFRHQDLHAAHS